MVYGGLYTGFSSMLQSRSSNSCRSYYASATNGDSGADPEQVGIGHQERLGKEREADRKGKQISTQQEKEEEMEATKCAVPLEKKRQ